MRSEAEYMYASARIRAAEGRDTAKVRLERMLECRSVEQLYRTVLEYLPEHPPTLAEALDRILTNSVALVRNNVPEPALYDFLLYKYDCCNIKTALKAGILREEQDRPYYLCGTFDPAGLAGRLAAGDVTGLPSRMGEAVSEAAAAYAETGEGCVIDFCLDRACFADMAANTEKYAVPLFREYASAMADIANIRSSVRLASRGTRGTGVWKQAFVPGGTLSMEMFTAGRCPGYEKLREILLPGMLKDAVERILAAGDEAHPDVVWDDVLYRIMNRNRYTPFGVHIPAVFLTGREAELKNCRIIAAGLADGRTYGELRERVRWEYV